MYLLHRVLQFIFHFLNIGSGAHVFSCRSIYMDSASMLPRCLYFTQTRIPCVCWHAAFETSPRTHVSYSIRTHNFLYALRTPARYVCKTTSFLYANNINQLWQMSQKKRNNSRDCVQTICISGEICIHSTKAPWTRRSCMMYELNEPIKNEKA